ncbi:hypothetical protein N7456_005146 [Penicillium angulare]|uniref:Amino acid/polyamine transporter I n=1 Tax=Penicillium angulare TaxID=116970 RepID=A0A9W9FXZ6_9EURO|nr:hypothetical protein N7456_005146 [Penicillium angulare]
MASEQTDKSQHKDIQLISNNDGYIAPAKDIDTDSDEGLLENIGYQQEFKREFTRISTLSYAVAVQGVLGSVSATWSSPFIAGGPATAIWTWFTGGILAFCIALSVAELISSYPTAGGIYFVSKYVFPEDKVPMAAWLIGWSNILGQTAGVASVGYSVGQMLLALVAVGMSDGNGNLTYVPTAAHTVAVTICILVIQGLYCSLPSKYLSKSIQWFAPVNILGSIAICIVILVFTDNKLPAAEVFGHVQDTSGWNNAGFSFLIGYLCVAWSFTDYDATAHMSEEIQNAAISGPIAIIQSLLITWILGLLLSISYGFCSADPSSLSNSQFGNPVTQIYINAVGIKGAMALWIWVVLVQFFTGATAMLSDTRTVFALARDEMFPFSNILRKVIPLTGTPLYSVWTVVIVCCLLNLIALGSTQTINGIFGVTAPACDLSYIAVIIGRLYYDRQLPISKGPFSLGRFQKPINYIACTWVIFISVILFLPPTYPVTSENMNYAVVIVVAIVVFATAWWYIEAKKRYIGPRNEANMDNDPSMAAYT